MEEDQQHLQDLDCDESHISRPTCRNCGSKLEALPGEDCEGGNIREATKASEFYRDGGDRAGHHQLSSSSSALSPSDHLCLG